MMAAGVKIEWIVSDTITETATPGEEREEQGPAAAGLAMIIGGAAGNLLDRIVAGSVVDFVDVYWRTYHFWAFNVADSAITLGVAIMILDMLDVGTHVSKTA